MTAYLLSASLLLLALVVAWISSRFGADPPPSWDETETWERYVAGLRRQVRQTERARRR